MDTTVMHGRRGRARRGAAVAAAALTAAATLAVAAPEQAAGAPAAPSCSQTTYQPWKSGGQVHAAVRVSCDRSVASIFTYVSVEYFSGGSWRGRGHYAQSGTEHHTASSTRYASPIECPGVLTALTFRTISRAEVNGSGMRREVSPAVVFTC